jgi:hypothetical protein
VLGHQPGGQFGRDILTVVTNGRPRERIFGGWADIPRHAVADLRRATRHLRDVAHG